MRLLLKFLKLYKKVRYTFMSTAIFNLYKRLIKNYNNAYTEAELAGMVDNQHEKGRLTDSEYETLCVMIDERFNQ